MAEETFVPDHSRANAVSLHFAHLRNGFRRGLRRAVPVLLTILAILLFWEGSKRLLAISDQRLPSLVALVEAMFTRTQGGAGPLLITQMLLNAWATFKVAAGGFVVGGILGFGLALLFIQAPPLERGLLPYVIGSQTVPILAIAPMVVVGLGRMGAQPWVAKMVVAAYLTFFPVTIGMLRGLRAASPLSRDLMQRKPVSVKETLKALLMRTRTIIFRNDQLRRRMAAEQQELEDIIKWVEGDGS